MKRKHILTAVCMMLLAVLWMSAGCTAEPDPAPSETTAVPQAAAEASVPGIGLQVYEGNAIAEGYTGTNLGGYPYALPIANEDGSVSFGESFNEWVDQVSVKNNGIWQGKPVIPRSLMDDFENCGSFWTGEFSEGGEQVFYDLFSDSYLNGIEYASMYTGVPKAGLKDYIINTITWMYKEEAGSDTRYTPAGLELTCADEHLKTIKYSTRYGVPRATIQFLDDSGKSDGIDHEVLDVLFSDSWSVKERTAWIKDGMLSLSYDSDADAFCSIPVIDTEDYLMKYYPGFEVVQNKMLAEISASMEKLDPESLQVSYNTWSEGRYFVLELLLNEQTQTFYYIDMVTGEETSAEEVFSGMGMDREILNEKLLPLIDERYQNHCASITGQPFQWEHDEALYQKTLSAENLQNMHLSFFDSSLTVRFPAWYPGSETAFMETLEVPMFEKNGAELDGTSCMDAADVMMFPGLMELLVSRNSSIVGNGTMDYVAWQHNDVLIVAIGWFGADDDAFDYDVCSVDLNTGMWFDCSETLEDLGQDYDSFRSYVLDALKLKLESRG